MAKKTLDQLADEAIAISAEIKTLDATIAMATDSRVEKNIALAYVCTAAFDRIVLEYPGAGKGEGGGKGMYYPGRRLAQEAWAERAGMGYHRAITLAGWGRAKEVRKAVTRGIMMRRQSTKKSTTKYYKKAHERNTLPGAFAIMLQRIEATPPEEFITYESVKEIDILRLINFLQIAIAGSRAKAA